MTVTLVHHADAEMPHVDALRGLTARGQEQAAWVAARIAASGFKPAAIWHSGKLRSRQTAEACYRACNPFADFKMVRGLSPDDPVSTMRDALLRETRDILLVGHRPHLPMLLRVMSPLSAAFPTHGAVCLEFDDADASWIERWRVQPPH